MATKGWLELRQHADTGIETIKAHFEGHAFDPHWHDSYLVGITLAGTQQFHCRRERHHSLPGDAFLLEPGEIHDGDAPVYRYWYKMILVEEVLLRHRVQHRVMLAAKRQSCSQVHISRMPSSGRLDCQSSIRECGSLRWGCTL